MLVIIIEEIKICLNSYIATFPLNQTKSVCSLIKIMGYTHFDKRKLSFFRVFGWDF